MVSNYTGERRRTGVMGHFYLLVADGREEPRQQQPAPSKRRRRPSLCFSFPVPCERATAIYQFLNLTRSGTNMLQFALSNFNLQGAPLHGCRSGNLPWKTTMPRKQAQA
jgi:hypothetical protein